MHESIGAEKNATNLCQSFDSDYPLCGTSREPIVPLVVLCELRDPAQAIIDQYTLDFCGCHTDATQLVVVHRTTKLLDSLPCWFPRQLVQFAELQGCAETCEGGYGVLGQGSTRCFRYKALEVKVISVLGLQKWVRMVIDGRIGERDASEFREGERVHDSRPRRVVKLTAGRDKSLGMHRTPIYKHSAALID